MRKEKQAEFRLLLTTLFKLSLGQDPAAIIIQIQKMEIWVERYVSEEVEECVRPFMFNNKITDSEN